MSITKEDIQEIIKKFGKNEKDTGSPEVQIAILTKEILNLQDHLNKHKQDKNSKNSLIKKVSKRKKLLNYLKRKFPERYQKLVKELEL
jgi:small subunit ribosomal protein S15